VGIQGNKIAGTMTSGGSDPSNQVLRPHVGAGTAPTPADRIAAALRGFGPLGILAVLLILLTGNLVVGKKMIVLPVGAVLVLLWTRLSRTPWREIGYVRPKTWVGTLAVGLAFGIAFKLLMKAIVMPLLGADPINRAYHFLAGNTAMLPTAVWAMLTAGFAEETVVRGYLFERLSKLLGTGMGAKTIIVLVTTAGFAVAHYPVQGLAGTEQAAITGLVFGVIFAVTGRIWIPMFAHSAFDLTALAIIYWNLESDVAHVVFG
jgi:membrane protease YdiL (CAAX protease family)